MQFESRTAYCWNPRESGTNGAGSEDQSRRNGSIVLERNVGKKKILSVNVLGWLAYSTTVFL